MTVQQGSQFDKNPTATDTQEISNSFEHLVVATAADCTAVANLTHSNQAFSEELQVRNNKLQASNVPNTTLQQKLAKLEQEFAALKVPFQNTQTTVLRMSSTPPTNVQPYGATLC